MSSDDESTVRPSDETFAVPSDARVTRVPDDEGAEQSSPHTYAGALPTEDTAVPALRLPAPYRDLGTIASGAMGEIRRVLDQRLDRPLAMKIMHPSQAAMVDALPRFEREARVTAQLQHPGIVPVHDTGFLPDGRAWFTMREVRGATLGTLIDEVHRVSTPDSWGETPDGWGLRRIVAAFESICQTVAFAHGHGVVHRDLKPENVMVGSFGEVQVMDWEIARAPRESDDTGAAETLTGQVIGTPAYMAPEQAWGEVDLHTPATDVYALGAVLYHILAGRPCIDEQNAWRAVARHGARAPAPRSTGWLRSRRRPWRFASGRRRPSAAPARCSRRPAPTTR